MSDWQLIETAPKDEFVLVYNTLGNVHVARFGVRYLGDPYPENWCANGKWVGGGVTHWQPLPAPPDSPAVSEQGEA